MKNNFGIKIGALIVAFILCQSVRSMEPKTKSLQGKINEDIQELVRECYTKIKPRITSEDIKNSRLHPEFMIKIKNLPNLIDLLVTDFVEYLEYPEKSEARLNEEKAYRELLPRFFEMVKSESNKPYLLWQTNITTFDWWKALNAKGGVADDFMAYLYNINDSEKQRQSGIRVKNQGGYKLYTLDGIPFKKESPSFLSKHWGKLALGAAALATAYLNRDRLKPYMGYFRLTRSITRQGSRAHSSIE